MLSRIDRRVEKIEKLLRGEEDAATPNGLMQLVARNTEFRQKIGRAHV